MLIILSPTKEWNPIKELPPTYRRTPQEQPKFYSEAVKLNGLLKAYDPVSLAKLMKMSHSLAEETHRRVQNFYFGVNPQDQKPAFLSYGGTVYKGLEPETLCEKALAHGQKHVRILSGLYGILKPLDTIIPYRLEMKTPLEIQGEGRLNKFWKSRITRGLQEDPVLSESSAPVVNLASGEYSGTVDRKILGHPMITIHFKEKINCGYRVVGMYAKMARGKMLRSILLKQMDRPELIKKIKFDGYSYNSMASDKDNWVFSR